MPEAIHAAIIVRKKKFALPDLFALNQSGILHLEIAYIENNLSFLHPKLI